MKTLLSLFQSSGHRPPAPIAAPAAAPITHTDRALACLEAENAQLRQQVAELHRALLAVYDRGAHAQAAQVETMLRQATPPPVASVVTAQPSEVPTA
jgi:hypothetical protein